MKVTLGYLGKNIPKIELVPETDVEHMALQHWKYNRGVGSHGELVILEVEDKKEKGR